MAKKKTKISKATKAQSKRTGAIPIVTGSNKFQDLTDGYALSSVLDYDFPPELIIKYALEDPIIRAAVNKKATKVLSESYKVEPIDDNPQAQAELKIWEEFEKSAGGKIEEDEEQINFDGVLYSTLISLSKSDELWWEIRSNKLGLPGEINTLDWEDMRVKPANLNGKIKEYVQVKAGRIVARWKPQEIIHRSMYVEGTRLYGSSLIRSIMWQASGRMFAIKYANSIFVNQKPKGIWKFDLDDAEFKKIKDMLKEGKMNPQYDIVLQTKGDKMSYDNVPISTEMDYKDFLKDNAKEILIGMGVPPGSVFMSGEAGGWEADVALHEFDEEINRIRTFLEGIVNEILFPRFGFTALTFRFNRSNKRDTEREAKITQMISGIATINERRTMIGLPEIEEGDEIRQESNNFGQSNNNSRENDDTDQEGESKGDKELGKINATYKNPNYFRKSYGNSMFNKSIKPKKPNPLKNIKKRLPKIDRFINNYQTTVDTMLREYMDKIKIVIQESNIDSVLNKTFKKIERLKDQLEGKKLLMKVINPVIEDLNIDDLQNEFTIKSRDITKQLTRDSYNYGIDVAELEIGFGFAKVAISPETLAFLETLNIDLVEGAFSEVAKRAKVNIKIGMERGESIPQIVQRLDNMKGSIEQVYKNRTENIARSEVIRAANMGSIEAYKNSGVVNKIQVIVGPDPDGNCRQEWGAPPGGLSKPMDLDEFHQVHPRCACTPVPVL